MAQFPIITAVLDQILVRPLEVESMTRGMLRPGSGSERSREGVVMLVGPGRVTESGHRVEPEMHPGDLVLFPEYAGKELVEPRGFPRGVYLIMRNSEVQLNLGPAAAWLPPEETHE